jgi:hypothetical protein
MPRPARRGLVDTGALDTGPNQPTAAAGERLLRYVSETWITQTIERPQAILKLTGLPTTAPTAAATGGGGEAKK